VKAGFDPAKVSDPMYYCDPKSGSFKPLKKAAFDKITSGEIRL